MYSNKIFLRWFPAFFLFYGFLTFSGLAQGVGGSDFQKNDITYSTEFETPHIKWAATLPEGPIKGFFVPSIRYGRDMVELMQRLQLNPVTVSYEREWMINSWGIGDYYGWNTRGDRNDYAIVNEYLEKDLTGEEKFEVMVIPGIHGWSRMTRPTRDAILERVRNGAGLVLIHPYVGNVETQPFNGDEKIGDKRIWEISSLINCLNDSVDKGGMPVRNEIAITKEKWEISKDHFITEGLDLELLPAGVVGGRLYKYEADGEVIIKAGEHPLMAVKNYGKGRVVSMAYVNQGFIPEEINPVETGIYWNYWEYYYSLFARTVLWAAGRESDVSITSIKAGPVKSPDFSIMLSSNNERKIKIELSGRSEFGQLIKSTSSEKTLSRGDQTITISADKLEPDNGWPIGKVYFNCIIKDSETGATLNWGNVAIERPKQAEITEFNIEKEVYKELGSIKTTIKTEGDLNGLTVRVRVEDGLERVLSVSEKPAKSHIEMSNEIGYVVEESVFPIAELVNEDGIILSMAKIDMPILILPIERRKKEFYAGMSFSSNNRHFENKIKLQLFRKANTKPISPMGMTLNYHTEMPKNTFGIGLYGSGPKTEEGQQPEIEEYKKTGDLSCLSYRTRKRMYKETGNKKFLIRQPCLDDPEFRDSVYRVVRQSVIPKAKYEFDYYFVTDEGSLSSYTDPEDFCWGEHTLKNFRSWLKTVYKSLSKLNEEWGTDYKAWRDVVPYTTAEATEKQSFAPWADHRSYMDISFSGAYQMVRNALIDADPEAHIALSGTQVTTSYNGCNWYLLDKVIDDMISYEGGNQWDLHRSLAKPNAMIGFWTGYGKNGMAVKNDIWTATIKNALYPNIFWKHSFIDPDFTYSKSATDLSEVFNELKDKGIAKTMMEAEYLTTGIALHYSTPSLHAASITNNQPENEIYSIPNYELKKDVINRNYGADQDGWVKIINDLGMQFKFVAYKDIEVLKLQEDNYKIFVMPFSMAISEEEAAAIREFVKNGGVVISDGAGGIMNDHCSWQEKGMLDDLFGISAPISRERELKGITGKVEVTKEGEAYKLDAKKLKGLEALEPNIKAEQAKSLISIDGESAVFANKYGKGYAFQLNILLDQYPNLRENNYGGETYRYLLSKILSYVNIRPDIKVFTSDSNQLERALISRYKMGNSKLIAIVKEYTGEKALMSKDGVTPDEIIKYEENLEVQNINIMLPEKYYVYDVRKGKEMGFTDKIKTSITDGDAVVIGLSPEKNTINISGPGEISPGVQPEFIVSSELERPQVIRCHLFGPEGEYIPAYSQNIILKKGKGKVIFPLTLSDIEGEYKIEISDVITGASEETSFRIK